MKKIFLILPIIALLNIAYCDGAPKSSKKKSKKNTSTLVFHGKTLPAWSEGCLDIHFINSARGECCFYILPDGTTLLVDAGEVNGGSTSVPQRPNENVRPYIVYANYIKHFLPKGKKAIDYCLPTHFNIDHILSADSATEVSPVGYHKSGLMALYDKVPYRYILDRSYPNYATESMSGQISVDWGKFVTWGVQNRKFKAEQFTVGKEQIVMLNKPKAHKNFSIFNICANGQVWGRTKSGVEKVIDKKNEKGGNPCSCGFHLTYGKFDYIACGDLVGRAQNRVAFYFRDFIGEGNLDAFKANHHLAGNSWGSKMQEVNFNPRVVLNHCFTSNKPDIEKLKHVLPVVEGFFATNLHKDFIANPDVKANKLADKITAYNGHIVLRVMPGGECFYVYMLDDSDFEYRVKFIAGPYYSK